MSTASRKSGNRAVFLRERSLSMISGWDDTIPLEPNEVFLPLLNSDETLDRMEHCIAEANLTMLEQQFLDGGVLVRFRRKHDADVFRRIMMA